LLEPWHRQSRRYTEDGTPANDRWAIAQPEPIRLQPCLSRYRQEWIPLGFGKLPCNLSTGVELICDANSVIVLSSMGDDPQDNPNASGVK